ncbi:MAG: LamG-like jellyroll fold domain-containing protein, partial [Bacteroidia bacterium]
MKQLFSTLLIALALLLASGTSYAQDGANDPTFNPTDKGFDYGIGANNTVWKTAEQADGKIIIVGFFSSYNGFAVNGVARLNTNGSIDSTFNTGGAGATGGVYSVVLQPDGKIIIGGNFIAYNGVGCNRLVRLTTTGILDTTFNATSGTNNVIQQLALQPDGKIVAVGAFTANGLTSNRIARFNSNGSIDTTFNVGTGFDQDVYGVALQTDNKIVVGGFFSTYNGVGQNRMVRLNSNGSIDTTFNIGTGPNNALFAVAIQPDGKILLSGGQTAYNGSPCNFLTRINTNGSFDASFVTPAFNNQIRTIEILPSGKIAIGGDFTTNRIAMLNNDGSNDATFSIGTGFNNIILYIKARANGQFIVTGSFTLYNNNGIQKIACINANGTLDKTFNKNTGADGAVLASVIQPDGKTIIAGSFTKYNGTYVNRLARLNIDGAIDTTFNIGTGVNSNIRTIALQPDGKVIIAGDFTTFNGTTKSRITRLNTDGSLDASFGGTGANNIIYTTASQTDGKIIIGGNFTTYSGIARNRIVRINTDGTLDLTFNVTTGANSIVFTTAIQPDGKIIIGGSFTAYRSIVKSRIVRINTDGSVDATLNVGSGFDNSPFALAIQPDSKIVVGGIFTTYQGMSENKILRLNTDGSIDITFSIGTGLTSTGVVNAIGLQADGKIIIAGAFATYNGTSVNNIARITTNGIIDSTFATNVGIGANNTINTISLLNGGGNAIIGGLFTAYNTTGRNRVARIIASSCATPIVSSVAATRCNAGTVTLTATTSAGTLNWFDANIGGTNLGTGASFTTPSIATTTTYYVQAIDGACASARTAVVATVIIPTIASFLPLASGIGNSIIINGSNFTGATAVTIGGVNAITFVIISATQIRAVVPATTSGSIAVTTPCGIVTLAGFIFLTPPGNAFAFDGINDAVIINPGLSSSLDFTWEAWFKTGSDGTIMSKSAATWFTGGKSLLILNGKIVFDSYNIGNMQSTNNSYADWKWHHVALTAQMNYSGAADNVMMYVDGELTAQRNDWDISSATEATLQNRIGGAAGGGYLNGTIDEVRIWNTALTQAEIQANKNNPISPILHLMAYYSFDEGIPAGNNVGLTTLYDQNSSLYNGSISGATLTGSTSNFVGSYAMVVPTAMTTTNYTGTSATAQWIAPITGIVDAYELEVSQSPIFTTVFAAVTGIAAFNYTITGLNPDSTYYYRVRAINNTLSEWGAYSNVIKICGTPTIVPTAGFTCGTGTVALKATASAGTLNWYTTATGGTITHTDTLFTTPILTTNTTYYVDVTYNACTSARIAIVAAVKTSSTATINASICNGNNYTFGTSTLTTSGTYTRTVPATNGCDSVITLNL